MSQDLIYDWNLVGQPNLQMVSTVACLDETLAEALAATTVVQPDLAARHELLRLAAEAGLGHVHLGPVHGTHVQAMLDFINGERLPLKAAVSLRAGLRRVLPFPTSVPEVRVHASVSRPILSALNKTIESVVGELVSLLNTLSGPGRELVWVAEDVTRTTPEALSSTLRAVVSAGVRRVCLTDSTGVAMPIGVQRLLECVRRDYPEVSWEWAGRNDRGLAVINALTALSHGAARICGTALGIGEGPGVIALDTVLTNCVLMQPSTLNLVGLKDYCRRVAEVLQVRIPVNYPVLGEDAFRTATGVHAAAIVKARKKGDVELADRVYSGIPAGWFGLSQKIDIGPMSGISNVSCWLEERHLSSTAEDIHRILQRAKQSNRTLTEAEVLQVLHATV